MGAILEQQSGARRTLGARSLVGRGRRCALRIDDRVVSGEHATIWWDGAGWQLRDLGSTNGTFLDGERLKTGATVALSVGQSIGFGARGGWTLVDSGPPVPTLYCVETGQLVRIVDGFAALPDDEKPESTVFSDSSGRWWAETEGGRVPLGPDTQLTVGGSRWVLELPDLLDVTVDCQLNTPTMETIELVFSISQGGDYVHLDVLWEQTRLGMSPRAHTGLLQHLAQMRLDDAHLPAAERGWRQHSAVCEGLGLDRRALNVQVFRARQQLAQCGVAGAVALVERRFGTTLLRIGTDRLRVCHQQ